MRELGKKGKKFHPWWMETVKEIGSNSRLSLDEIHDVAFSAYFEGHSTGWDSGWDSCNKYIGTKIIIGIMIGLPIGYVLHGFISML